VAERRDVLQDELRSAAQARAWAGGDFDADHGLGIDGVGGRSPALGPAIRSGCAGPTRCCGLPRSLLPGLEITGTSYPLQTNQNSR
jgi:hypothetical protein